MSKQEMYRENRASFGRNYVVFLLSLEREKKTCWLVLTLHQTAIFVCSGLSLPLNKISERSY